MAWSAATTRTVGPCWVSMSPTQASTAARAASEPVDLEAVDGQGRADPLDARRRATVFGAGQPAAQRGRGARPPTPRGGAAASRNAARIDRRSVARTLSRSRSARTQVSASTAPGSGTRSGSARGRPRTTSAPALGDDVRPDVEVQVGPDHQLDAVDDVLGRAQLDVVRLLFGWHGHEAVRTRRRRGAQASAPRPPSLPGHPTSRARGLAGRTS